MANNQAEFSLLFKADTRQAYRDVQKLSKSLSDLNKGINFTGNTTYIKEASQAALDLQSNLRAAFNPQTQQLNLSRFNQEMKASGQTLATYADRLDSLGPAGRQTFDQLTRSIAQTSTPVITLTGKLQRLFATFGNAVRWRMTTAAIGAVTGAISGAMQYAQELNKSLNNIRIVTGNSADEMAKFAQYANKAAKELSTTTTAYTDAALIFYQQGLGDDEVKARTETTLKLSNVTGESVSEISSQLTAIWNNFADGSTNLERYADIITALGAATASSSKEISDGLQKFAAIGNTVGLSYEYATTALATVVATTRESADTVGTAFKTLFGRIQSLQQGDSVEDGTTLTKYSAALAKVGVAVKDENDQLRAMDDILDDVGARWGELDKAQRVALASTVGGIRQYQQFIALMDNWDMFKKNLSIANTADGTLEKQQKIYAESWEAARKQVQASAQGLFDDLINDKFFIQLTTFGSKLIDFIDTIVDGLGGVKGAILLIGSVLTQVFANKMPTIWQNVVDGFRVVTGRAKKDTLALQEQAAHEEEVLGVSSRFVADQVHHEGRQQELELRRQITAEAERMTDKEKLDAELLFERLQKHNEQREVLAQEVDEYIKMEREAKKQLATTEEVSAEYEAQRQTLLELKQLQKRGYDSKILDNQVANANTIYDQLANTNKFKYYAKEIQIKSSTSIDDTIKSTQGHIDRLTDYIGKLPPAWKGQETALQALIDKLKEYKAALEDIRQAKQGVDYIENGAKVESEASKEINEGSAGNYTKHFAKRAEEKENEYNNKAQQAKAGQGYLVEMYQKEANEYKKLQDAIRTGAQLTVQQVRSLEKLKAESIEEGTQEYVKQTAAVKGIGQALTVMEDTVGAAEVTMRSRAEAALQAIDDFGVDTTNVESQLKTLKAALNDPDATPDILEEALSNLMLRLEELAENGTKDVEKYAEKTGQNFDEVKAKADAEAEALAGIIRNQILLNKSKPNVNPPLTKPDTVAQISKAASAYMSLAMVTQSVSNALETLASSEASAEDKLKTIITTIPMAIMGVTRFIGSLKAAQAAGETLTVSLGWIGLVLAAIGATVMGAIKLYQHLTENNITVAEAADKAKESLERLSGALDTLNSSYDNYKDIAAGINLCTQGTDEWYQKTVELLNAQAKLTADNPTLANIVKNPEAYGLNPDEIYEEVNGVMVYTDKVIKAAQAELLNNNKIALESSVITEAVANVPEVINDLKKAQLNYTTLYTDATQGSLAQYQSIDPNVQLYDLMEKLNFAQLNELSSASSDTLSDTLNKMLIGILSEQYAGYENLTFGREATTKGASFLQGFFDQITEGELKEIVSYFRQRGANYQLKGYGTTDAQQRYWMYNQDAADTLYNNAKEWVNANKDNLKNTSEFRDRLASYLGLSPDEVTSKDISFGDNTIVVKGQNLDYGAAVQLIKPELFSEWKQDINNEFNQQLQKALSSDPLQNLFNAGGDWKQLSIGDLIQLKTRLGDFTNGEKAFFRQNGLDLDSIITGIDKSIDDKMLINGTNPQRYKTYQFLKENDLFNEDTGLTVDQLDTLADVDAQLLTASNNIDYIAQALEMSAENLPSVIKTWASNIATSVDGAAALLGKDFGNMIGIVEEAASGEAIKDADFEQLKKLFPDKELSDYFRLDDKTGKWTLQNTASAKAFATELRNVAAAAALSSNDITKAKRVYNSFGKTLEQVNSLHGQMAGIVGEKQAYEQARADAIGNELDNLKVSYTEYNQIIKDIQEHNGKDLPFVDEIALAVIKLGQSRDNLEKTWKQFKTGKQSGVAGQLGDSLAEIFGITDQSVKDKFTEDIEKGNFTNEIQIALTPNADPKEFAKALSKIQQQLQFYKLEAYISEDVNGLQGLTDELNAWKETTGDLSITALINDKQFTEKLNEMLRNGTITYNTLQAMFSALGGTLTTQYEWADGYKDISQTAIRGLRSRYERETESYPSFNDYLVAKGYKNAIFSFTPTEVTELSPDPDDTTGSTPSATEHKITAYKDKIATVDASISRLKDTISDTTEEIDKLKNALTDDNTYDAPEYLEAYVSALESWKKIRQDIINEYNGKQNIIETELTADSESFQKLLKELGTGITLGQYLLDNGLYDESELKKAFDAAFNTQVDRAAYNSLDSDVKKKFDEAERLMKNIFSESQDLYANQRELTKYIQESNAAIVEYAKVAEKAYSQTFENNVKRLNNKLKDNEVITKQLTRATSKANKEYSKAYGQDKITKAEQLQQAQAKENEQLKKTADLYEELRTVNRGELNDLMTRSGLLLDIEESDGYIVNSEFLIAELEAEITKLTNEINIGKRNGIALTAEEIQAEAERLAILERINDIISKNNEYRDSEYDALDKISENEDSIANLKYQMIIDKLNNQIKLSENELKLLDYDFKVLSSNFYTMGEAAALFLDKGDELVSRLDDYEDAFNELESSAKKGEIALSDYGEGLQQVFDGLLDTLGSIEDLTQEVKGYYGQTLQAGKAELDNYTKSLTRATATLNHYKTLLGLLGREADYDALGKIYEGLIKTTKNEYDTAKNWYELTKAQTEELYEQMQQYDKTSKAYEVLHQSWVDGLNEMDSAYSDMMSKFEAYNQAILDNYKNTLEKMARELEKSLTNNTTFDSLTKKLERMKGLDEEYLTKTNQIYELSKLAREAQKELDKNDNALSQQKLRNFIKETDALKNQNKFSNLELEIQKAKYDVMMAQMALDDAQMAKSKVRLQRNSEGGYGYVYTADSNAVDDAIQKYEDAQNRLYNIGLENAEQYTEQILQLMQEGTEQIKKVQEDYDNGLIGSLAEKEAQMNEISQYYLERIRQAEELYGIAMNRTNEHVREDTWTTQATMLASSEEFYTQTQKYMEDTSRAWIEYHNQMDEASKLVGEDTASVANNVAQITSDSEETAALISNEIMPGIEKVTTEAEKTAIQFAAWAKNVEGTIDHARELATEIQGIMRSLSGIDNASAEELAGLDKTAYDKNTDYSLEIAGRIYELKKLDQNSQEYLDKMAEIERLKLLRNAKMAGEGITGVQETESLTADLLEESLTYLNRYLRESEMSGRYGHFTMPQFDTGGYTGSWGSDGRVAMLHEKELVLNAEDTRNILSATEIVRKLASMFALPTFGFSAATMRNTNNGFEQNVHIDASFPNVQDHNEVEIAIQNLINTASQYVMGR